MLGGVAIFLAVMAVVPSMVHQRREAWVVLAASALLFVVGLVDDFLKIKPYQKLIGQLAGSAGVIYFGLVLPWTGSAPTNILLTFVWLIGITNAVNMLDNMDGLSVGISAVAAVFLGINFVLNGQFNEALMLAGFAGALLGFLIYNHSPASIFMGDCGSMFIGFILAATALKSGSGGGRSRSIVAVLAVPILVLFVPIFDTTFVTLMRKMAGRAASQGGRDHTSHRLVALGLSEKHAVWMLYALAVSAGLLALLARHASIDVSLVGIATFTIVLTFLGIHLGRVRVYDEAEIAAAREKPLVSFLFDLSHKRRVFEVLLDLVLIGLAYYLAYALKFGPVRDNGDWQLFIKTLPIVVVVKLAMFLATGIYRGIWRYASLTNVIDFARATVVSSVAMVLVIVFAFRFE
jgi:UDP-GlcNAc:undecaprenyl-phosphate GlcNAc-1-phosphate transferase